MPYALKKYIGIPIYIVNIFIFLIANNIMAGIDESYKHYDELELYILTNFTTYKIFLNIAIVFGITFFITGLLVGLFFLVREDIGDFMSLIIQIFVTIIMAIVFRILLDDHWYSYMFFYTMLMIGICIFKILTEEDDEYDDYYDDDEDNDDEDYGETEDKDYEEDRED